MGYEASVFLPDESATVRLGKAIAPMLGPGDTILLEGQIGAGKSVFARAIIRAMVPATGETELEVPSPTYTLVQTYNAPGVEVWHTDLYRLTDAFEVSELGLDDAVQSAVVLIEWPDRLDHPPDGALTLRFDVRESGRQLALASDSDRWKALQTVLNGV